MSEPNPLAFIVLNMPQFPPSEAMLRVELVRSKQNVAMLQREMRDLKDANGLAQGLAAGQEPSAGGSKRGEARSNC
jgi:hypothetical protein